MVGSSGSSMVVVVAVVVVIAVLVVLVLAKTVVRGGLLVPRVLKRLIVASLIKVHTST